MWHRSRASKKSAIMGQGIRTMRARDQVMAGPLCAESEMKFSFQETGGGNHPLAARICRMHIGTAESSSRDMGDLDKAPPGAPSPVALAAAAAAGFCRASFGSTGAVVALAQVDEALERKPV